MTTCPGALYVVVPPGNAVPVQAWVLHGADCCASPVHVSPPHAGAGASQVRVAIAVPPPHGAEQLPATHVDQPPFTGEQAAHLPLMQAKPASQSAVTAHGLGTASAESCATVASAAMSRGASGSETLSASASTAAASVPAAASPALGASPKPNATSAAASSAASAAIG